MVGFLVKENSSTADISNNFIMCMEFSAWFPAVWDNLDIRHSAMPCRRSWRLWDTRNLLSFGSLTAERRAQSCAHPSVITAASPTSCWGQWLPTEPHDLMKVDPTILTPKHNRAWNGITLLIQRGERPEQYSHLKKLWKDWFPAQKGNRQCSLLHLATPKTATCTLQHASNENNARLTVKKNIKAWVGNTPPTPSPDLVTSDSCLLGPLKDHMRNQHYKSNKEVQKIMCMWFANNESDFYCSSIFKLMLYWQKLQLICRTVVGTSPVIQIHSMYFHIYAFA